MRRAIAVLAGLAVLGAAGFWWLTRPARVSAAALPAHQADPEAGQLIFTAGGCTSCHAAPSAEGEDKLLLSGGLRIESDFGTFLAPNISPHPQAGIGGWTEAQFVTAMRKGTSPDGRHYYPAFPYTSYARMTDADLLDLFAYVKTLPQSDVASQPHELGFPFTVNRGIGLWKMLFLDPSPVLAAADDPLVARGRYLVEGPAHCGECHTPRNAIGGLQYDAWLSGGPNPDGEGRIPNITPAGLPWSAGDIAYYLESGFTPEFDSAGGSMVEVIRNTSQLPPEDREAIAAYLKAVPPVATE